MKLIKFNYHTTDAGGVKQITCDTTQPPFDSKPVLIKLSKGWCEARWDPVTGPDTNGEYDGFCWICLDDDFQAEWDEPSHWAPLPQGTGRAALIQKVWQQNRYRADFSKYDYFRATEMKPISQFDINAHVPEVIEVFTFNIEYGRWLGEPGYSITCDGVEVETRVRSTATIRLKLQ